jgi:hypothetical protein
LAEAGYAWKTKLPAQIVPVRVEKYAPKSWLGMVVGTKMYYDCMTVDEADTCAKKLIRAFAKIPEALSALVAKPAPARRSMAPRRPTM